MIMNYYKQLTKTFIVLASTLALSGCATVQTPENNSVLAERESALQCENMCNRFGEFVWMHSYSPLRDPACICKDIEWNYYSAQGVVDDVDDGVLLLKIEKP